jgi:hypothetical protein
LEDFAFLPLDQIAQFRLSFDLAERLSDVFRQPRWRGFAFLRSRLAPLSKRDPA